MTQQTYDPEAKGAKCSACPLRHTTRVVPPQWGTPKKDWPAPVVFVADAPGLHETKRGEPFVGPTGVKLGELTWDEMKAPAGEVMLKTSALLCRPETPGLEGRKKYEIKSYLAWLRKENVQRRKFGHPEMANPFECCYPRLKAELERAETITSRQEQLIVMPMGNFALAAVMGKPGKSQSVMKYRGSVIHPTQGE